MKPDEYKKLLKQAKNRAIKKWIDKVNGNNKWIRCPLCLLTEKVEETSGATYNCQICPINEKGAQCCVAYETWHFDRTAQNAQAVVDRLKLIDVDAWTEKLVHNGVLEK